MLFRFIYGKEENIDNIFVVDLNSTDKTSEILNMLANDYDCIKYTDIKNCKDILDSIGKRVKKRHSHYFIELCFYFS